MSVIYHFNQKTGKAGRCQAEKSCPFGGETGFENHFSSLHEALAKGIESSPEGKKLLESYLTSHKRQNRDFDIGDRMLSAAGGLTDFTIDNMPENALGGMTVGSVGAGVIAGAVGGITQGAPGLAAGAIGGVLIGAPTGILLALTLPLVAAGAIAAVAGGPKLASFIKRSIDKGRQFRIASKLKKYLEEGTEAEDLVEYR